MYSRRRFERRLSVEHMEDRRMLTTLVDLDGDSDLDVLFSDNQLNGFVWHENTNGYGKFKEHEISPDRGVTTTGDFDNDGDLDIFTSRGELFRNDGSGFESPVKVGFDMPDHINSLSTFDSGKDGDLDIIVKTWSWDPNLSTSISVIENTDGKGTFSLTETYLDTRFDSQNRTSTVLVDGNDANADGRIDLLGAFYRQDEDDHFAGVLSLQDEGEFAESIVFSIPPDEDALLTFLITDLEFADVNGDSKIDILGSTFNGHIGTGTTTVYWNDGDLAFPSHSLVATNSLFPEGFIQLHRMSDVDLDGDLDAVMNVFVDNPHLNPISPNSDFWMENVDGEFVSCKCSIGVSSAADIGDVSGDGIPDFVLAFDNQDQTELSWFDGSVTSTQGTIDAIQHAIRSETAPKNLDRNGDGHLTNHDLEQQIWDFGLVIGDVDLDGDLDTADLVKAFQIGEYEDDIMGNSTWSDGDWNSDGDFTTADLVYAFQAGGFRQSGLISGERGKITTVSSDPVVVDVGRLFDGDFSLYAAVELAVPSTVTFTLDQHYTLTHVELYNNEPLFGYGIERLELIFRDGQGNEMGRSVVTADPFNSLRQRIEFDAVEAVASVEILPESIDKASTASVVEIAFLGYPTLP